jgi:predicted SAM-dependent methyltransferase
MTSSDRDDLSRLRELQDRYYDRFDNSAIGEYIAALAELRRREAALQPQTRALHLGSGGHHLEGWINVDLDFNQIEVAANLAGHLPFRSASIDFVHMEDVIEHLTLPDADACLAEIARVLLPGGALRLLTPDLPKLIDAVYRHREPRHLAWCAQNLGASSPAEALNALMRMDGEHRFIFDEESLRDRLQKLGFEVFPAKWNESRFRELRFLDLRDFGLSMFLEAVKR